MAKVSVSPISYRSFGNRNAQDRIDPFWSHLSKSFCFVRETSWESFPFEYIIALPYPLDAKLRLMSVVILHRQNHEREVCETSHAPKLCEINRDFHNPRLAGFFRIRTKLRCLMIGGRCRLSFIAGFVPKSRRRSFETTCLYISPPP